MLAESHETGAEVTFELTPTGPTTGSQYRRRQEKKVLRGKLKIPSGSGCRAHGLRMFTVAGAGIVAQHGVAMGVDVPEVGAGRQDCPLATSW